MKKYLFIFLLLIGFGCSAQELRLLSWNIQNLGKSKSEEELAYVATLISRYDLIAIQEVVAGPGGSQAVAQLADELNRLGMKWDYTISNPTTGKARERYAFIWKTGVLQKKGDAWLDQKYEQQIEREPYFCRFELGKKTFTVASFHAIPKSKQPATEIKYLKFLPARYPKDRLIFCGDFNLPQSNNVFLPLKKIGYEPALIGLKTSLKQECKDGDCLASEYDNFFYNRLSIKAIRSGLIHFYKDFTQMRAARSISDHVPVYLEFDIK